MRINKGDIEDLDELLKVLNNEGKVDMNTLMSIGQIEKLPHDRADKEAFGVKLFRYYLPILEFYCANVEEIKHNQSVDYILVKNYKTYNFMLSGGFKKAFNRQQKIKLTKFTSQILISIVSAIIGSIITVILTLN